MISPGGRPADPSPIGHGGDNWVTRAGGLPTYMRMIAHALMRKGMSASHAIATAHETLERLAATSNNPKVKAAASAALAEWNAKRLKSKVDMSMSGFIDFRDMIDLSTVAAAEDDLELATEALEDGEVLLDLAAMSDEDAALVLDLAPGDGRPPYHWKHGFIPITPAAALSKAKGDRRRAARLLQSGGKVSPADAARKLAGMPGSKSRKRVAGERRKPATPAVTEPMKPAATPEADAAARGRGISPERAARATGRREYLADRGIISREQADRDNAATRDRVTGPTDAEKIKNAERMFGTGSKQHKAAQERFGGSDLSGKTNDQLKRALGQHKSAGRTEQAAAVQAEMDARRAAGKGPRRNVGGTLTADPNAGRTATRGDGVTTGPRGVPLDKDGFPDNGPKKPADMTSAELVAEQDRLGNYIRGQAGGTASREDVDRWQTRRRELETERQKRVRDAMRSHPDNAPKAGDDLSGMSSHDLMRYRDRHGASSDKGKAAIGELEKRSGRRQPGEKPVGMSADEWKERQELGDQYDQRRYPGVPYENGKSNSRNNAEHAETVAAAKELFEARRKAADEGRPSAQIGMYDGKTDPLRWKREQESGNKSAEDMKARPDEAPGDYAKRIGMTFPKPEVKSHGLIGDGATVEKRGTSVGGASSDSKSKGYRDLDGPRLVDEVAARGILSPQRASTKTDAQLRTMLKDHDRNPNASHEDNARARATGTPAAPNAGATRRRAPGDMVTGEDVFPGDEFERAGSTYRVGEGGHTVNTRTGNPGPKTFNLEGTVKLTKVSDRKAGGSPKGDAGVKPAPEHSTKRAGDRDEATVFDQSPELLEAFGGEKSLFSPENRPTAKPAGDKPAADAPSSSTTSSNPDAPIRVEHTPDGTLVHGTSREDAPALKAQGFKWSRNLGAWYLPRTWNESTRDQRVKRLEASLGDKVGVDRTTGPRKSAAEREQETRDRAAARADRMDARAEKRSAEAERRFEASDLREEKSGIPFGQPILVGHHSERRHRRAIEKAHANLGKGVEAQREAEAAQAAAERARRTAAGDESKTTIGNRINKNEAELRDIQRRLDGTSGAQSGAATGEHRTRLEGMKADLEDRIQHDKGKLDAAGGVPSKDTVAPGDFVKVRGRWYPVLKSNGKTATVPSPMIEGRTDTTPWHEVTEHRKAGDVSREDVARMVQETSSAFPALRRELAKRAPAKDAVPSRGEDAPKAAPGQGAGADSSTSGRAPVKLTPAAQRDLDKIAAGESVSLRYGPYAQLRDAGYVSGPHEDYQLTDAGRSAARNAGNVNPQGKNEPPAKLTPAVVQRLSDDQLERALSRLFEAGATDTAALKALEDELDRRDREKNGGGSGKGEAAPAAATVEDPALDDLTHRADRSASKFTPEVIDRLSQPQLDRAIATLIGAGYDADDTPVAGMIDRLEAKHGKRAAAPYRKVTREQREKDERRTRRAEHGTVAEQKDAYRRWVEHQANRMQDDDVVGAYALAKGSRSGAKRGAGGKAMEAADLFTMTPAQIRANASEEALRWFGIPGNEPLPFDAWRAAHLGATDRRAVESLRRRREQWLSEFG